MINKGAIAEQGTHEELLRMNGVYKKLVLRQLEKNASDFNGDGDDDDENPTTSTEEQDDGVDRNGDQKPPPGIVRQLSDSLM